MDEMIGFFSDDAVYIDGPRGVHTGIDAIRAELQSQLAMVRYTRVNIKSLAASGGSVLTERVDNCEIAGKSISFECVSVFDVDPEGRIVRWRDYYDLPTFVEQTKAATAAQA